MLTCLGKYVGLCSEQLKSEAEELLSVVRGSTGRLDNAGGACAGSNCCPGPSAGSRCAALHPVGTRRPLPRPALCASLARALNPPSLPPRPQVRDCEFGDVDAADAYELAEAAVQLAGVQLSLIRQLARGADLAVAFQHGVVGEAADQRKQVRRSSGPVSAPRAPCARPALPPWPCRAAVLAQAGRHLPPRLLPASCSACRTASAGGPRRAA